MSIAAEPLLYALSADPPLARPGQTVTLRFRAPNLGSAPTAAGTVVFALPDGLLAEAVEVAVPAVQPGEDVCATLAVRVAETAVDGEALQVEARLVLPEATFLTNAAAVRIRARAWIDGPASRVDLLAGAGDALLVRAHLVNSGDGVVHGARIVLAAPHGCTLDDDRAAADVAIPSLPPGARFEATCAARIVAPAGTLRAASCYVVFADGTRAAIAAGEELTPPAMLQPPELSVTATRRGWILEATIANAGWSDADDVPVQVSLPAGLRLESGTRVDGIAADTRKRGAGGALAYAVLRSAGSVHDIRLARVAARTSAVIRLRIGARTAALDAGTCVVSSNGGDARVDLEPIVHRDVRLRALDVPTHVHAGMAATAVIELLNAGDIAECISLECDAAAATAAQALAPGALCRIAVDLPIAAAPDDTLVHTRVIARDRDGTVRAELPLALVMRARAWIVMSDEPALRDGSVRYAFAHRGLGGAIALRARWHDGTETALAAVAPGSAFAVDIDADRARGGGRLIDERDTLVCTLPPFHADAGPAPTATLESADTLYAGAAFVTHAAIDIADHMEQLALSVRLLGCTYVPGSVLLDGRRLIDGTTAADVLSALVMRDITGPRRIELQWTSIAGSASGTVAIALCADAGIRGTSRAEFHAAVAPAPTFALRPPDLEYHVDARTAPAASRDHGAPFAEVPAHEADIPIDAPISVPDPRPPWQDAMPYVRAAENESASGALGLAIGRARLDECARALAPEGGAILAHHLLTLRVLMPDRVVAGASSAQHALDDAHAALRDVFDRLFVKVRIPGFEPRASDFEDAAMRRAVIALFETLIAAQPNRAGLRAALSRFADAPYGAADLLHALLQLLPAAGGCTDDFGRAIAAYVAELERVLEPLTREPLTAFEDALVTTPPYALSAARRELAAAAHARAAAGAAS